MFTVGVIVSYFLIFPLTFRFLGTYQVSGDVDNLITLDSIDEPLIVEAKVNYRAKPQKATAEIVDNILHVHFDEPIRSAAPGQAVVLYCGDVVVGGATIKSSC